MWEEHGEHGAARAQGEGGSASFGRGQREDGRTELRKMRKKVGSL